MLSESVFIEQITTLFEVTPKNMLNMDTKFHELAEWDSMIELSVISLIDSEFKYNLSGKDLAQMVTFADMYHKISKTF